MSFALEEISTKELAEVLDLVDSRVRQLTLRGILIPIEGKSGRGHRFILGQAVRAYIAFRLEGAASTPLGEQLQESRRRKIDIDSRLAELRLKEREAEVGPLPVQLRKMASDYAIVRAVVEKLPDVIFSGLNGSGTPEARVRVDRVISVALEAMRAPAGAPKEAKK
jgi:phage terminase Nu1 subunit (DNA packaging protein)